MPLNKPQATRQISIDHNRYDPIDRFNSYWLNAITLPTRPLDLAYDGLFTVVGVGLFVSLAISIRPVLTIISNFMFGIGIVALPVAVGIFGKIWVDMPRLRHALIYRTSLTVIGIFVAL